METNEESVNIFLETVLSNGYAKKSYGYTKQTKENTHWITLFNNNKFQMYAYSTEDCEFDKIYDSGIIGNASKEQLQQLIEVLVKNHS